VMLAWRVFEPILGMAFCAAHLVIGKGTEGLAMSYAAYTTTYQVNTVIDLVDTNPGDGQQLFTARRFGMAQRWMSVRRLGAARPIRWAGQRPPIR
jgi:hypothetical protein